MRLIGNIQGKGRLHSLKVHLKKAALEYQIEELENGIFALWIINEEDLAKASAVLKNCQEQADFPVEEVHEIAASPPLRFKTPKKAFLTSIILAICIFIFLLNLVEEVELAQKFKNYQYLMTNVELNLFFDVPEEIYEISNFVKKYDINPEGSLKDMPQSAQEELLKIKKSGTWDGIYEYLVPKIAPLAMPFRDAKLFAKIREGEVWRFFTPAILHVTFIHLLFNVLWLWVLGKQLEERLSRFRYLGLIVLLGLFTNIAQYLMSGPLFLGYSGILMGQVGFIWSRQKVAPWEGYPLPRSTIYFLVLFVLGMLLLQLGVFAMQWLKKGFTFSFAIANTAHISGAILGVLLGRLSFFAREKK